MQREIIEWGLNLTISQPCGIEQNTVVQWYTAEEGWDHEPESWEPPRIRDPQGLSPGIALYSLSLTLPQETQPFEIVSSSRNQVIKL